MEKCREKVLKSENGAVTILVLITILTFVLVLLGGYLTVTTLRKSQIESDIRIQNIYSKGIENVDEVYDEVLENRILQNKEK